VLHEVEHWRLARTAWAAVRLGAPEATLMVSRRGVRLFAADDPAAPAWWISTTIRWPSAAGGRALVAPPRAIAGALELAGRPRGRYGTSVYYGDSAIYFSGLGGTAAVRGRTVPFGAGESAVPVGDEGLVLDGDYAVAEVALLYLEFMGAVRAAAGPAVELRLAEEPAGAFPRWWLEVAGGGFTRRLPVEVRAPPERAPVAGRYPAKIMRELLIPVYGTLALEFTEPESNPALRARWADYHRSTEFFVAPLS